MALQEQKFKVDYDNLVVVQVIWTDAEADNSWKDIENMCSITDTKTIGFLLKETKEEIVLVSSLTPKLMISGDWAIPKGMVKEIKRYKI